MAFDRLILVQNGLRKKSGHWLIETREWRNAAQKLGLKWLGFANKRFDSDAASAEDIKAVFTVAPYDYVIAPPATQKLATFIELSDEFRRVGQKYFPEDISANDLLLIPFTSDTEIFGVAKWLDRIQPEKRPAVAFMMHQFDLTWKIDIRTLSVNGDFTTWEYAVRAIMQRMPQNKIRFFSGGDLLSAALGKILKTTVQTTPLISSCPAQTPPDYLNKKYDVGIMGGAREEQGIAIWAEILIALAALRPDLAVSLQVDTKEKQDEMSRLLEPHVKPENMDIHAGMLFGDDYYNRMLNCRLLLFPYNPEKYAFRESGVFIESVARNIPAIVPEFTSMARHIRSKQAAGVIFEGWAAPSIANSIIHALNNIEMLNQSAALLSEKWINKHKAENILKSMLQSFA